MVILGPNTIVFDAFLGPSYLAQSRISRWLLGLKSLCVICRKMAVGADVGLSILRLSVRNLPTQVDEKQLKELFLQAAGGLPSKVKQVNLMYTHHCVQVDPRHCGYC